MRCGYGRPGCERAIDWENLMQTLTVLIGLFALTISSPQDDTIAQAFAHYEAIRAALAADHVKDVSRHATALAPLAEKVGGKEARESAEMVGAAKDLKAAREQFGKLSAALIPAFEKARLDGVNFFTCSMSEQSWAQKGKAIQNPYYGKSMLTCGTPKK